MELDYLDLSSRLSLDEESGPNLPGAAEAPCSSVSSSCSDLSSDDGGRSDGTVRIPLSGDDLPPDSTSAAGPCISVPIAAATSRTISSSNSDSTLRFQSLRSRICARRWRRRLKVKDFTPQLVEEVSRSTGISLCT